MVETTAPEPAADISEAEELVGPVFDQDELEADVGPTPPKAKKRRVRSRPSLRLTLTVCIWGHTDTYMCSSLAHQLFVKQTAVSERSLLV